jgi:hypothetical protein
MESIGYIVVLLFSSIFAYHLGKQTGREECEYEYKRALRRNQEIR